MGYTLAIRPWFLFNKPNKMTQNTHFDYLHKVKSKVFGTQIKIANMSVIMIMVCILVE